MHDVSFKLNGEAVQVRVEARTHLADVLRDALEMTGTHLGCEHGVCGACTVLVDGAPARSCLTFSPMCEGTEIRTIEGFANDRVMDALRDAFRTEHALQCGYCTPAFLITAYDIVHRLPEADEARVREELAGNLCRCTGYVGIVAAICTVIRSGIARVAPALIPGAAAPIRASRGSALPRAAPPSVAAVDLPRADSSPRTENATLNTDGVAVPASGANVTLERRIAIAVPADRLWSLLQSPASVVQCLPGARLRGAADAAPLEIEFTVSLGPIRASFQGEVQLHYEASTFRGRVVGSGQDKRSRTSANGEVDFCVEVDGTDDAILVLGATYALTGPLAQFARGTIVDALVDQIVAEFGRNAEAKALGKDTEQSGPVSAGGSVSAWQLLVGAIRASRIGTKWRQWKDR